MHQKSNDSTLSKNRTVKENKNEIQGWRQKVPLNVQLLHKKSKKFLSSFISCASRFKVCLSSTLKMHIHHQILFLFLKLRIWNFKSLDRKKQS